MPHDQPAREVDKRKPPLESRWTRNRRRLQAPAAPPPPDADYIVTGELTPDATGPYSLDGTIYGYPYYKHHTLAFYIWPNPDPQWFISTAPDNTEGAWSGPFATTPPGQYDPPLPENGVATVSLP